MAPRLFGQLANDVSKKQEVCLAAYTGHFSAAKVSKPLGRPSGALAVATYRFQPRRKNVPKPATLREVVKGLAHSEGLDERPPYIREQSLVRGVGSDIQAFGYDEAAVAEPERAALRVSCATTWRVYRQELFLNRDSEPFGVVEWKHTLNRIEVVQATGRPVVDRQ